MSGGGPPEVCREVERRQRSDEKEEEGDEEQGQSGRDERRRRRRGAIAETRASRTKGPKGGYRDIAQLCRGHKARISHLSSDRPNRSLYSGSLLLNMTICTGFIIVIPLSYFPLNQIPSLSFSSVFIEISPSSIQ